MSQSLKVVIADFISGDLSPEQTALGDIATITALDAFSEADLVGKIEDADAVMLYHNLALTAKILGLQSSALPKDKLGDVVGFLEQMVAQTNGIAPSFGDMTTQLVSGEVIAAFHGWSAMNNFAAEQGVTTIKTNLPNEGSHSFCDAYAIPSTAKNPNAALAWINQSLDPATNAEAATYLVGGVTVAAAVDKLDEVTRGLYPYDDLESLLEKAPLASLPPVESDDFVTFSEWQDAWAQLKAGS